jgi:DnaK suppressor protein
MTVQSSHGRSAEAGPRAYPASMAATPGADPPADPRAALLAARERLRREVGEAIQAPGQMTYGSQAAAASQVFEQQRDLALRDRAIQQLDAVDAALVRLEEGRFGTCLRCGRKIAPARLQALPWAANCIECQGAIDRERR